MATSSSLTRLVLGFLAGAIAVLTFHQGAVALLTKLGALSSSVYSMQPVRPLGVPQIASNAFWGGIWGIVFAAIAPRATRSARYWVTGLLLGAVALPLVGWFIVAPIKGLALAAGWVPSRMALSMIINGAWGIGTAAIFALVPRSRRQPRSRAAG